MDLGISGRKAIVCGSSRGLGRAIAGSLARAGCVVVLNGIDADRLKAEAGALHKETGADVIPVAADVTTREGQDALFAPCAAPDILITNAGGPPFKDFRQIDREAMLKGVTANMITPIELIQRAVDGMVERRFGRIVNITSVSVKMPVFGLDLSSGARAGLTAFLAGVSRSVAHANVTINNILPGYFDTDRYRAGIDATAKAQGKSHDAMHDERVATVPAKRAGNPAEFGDAAAFLCSSQAGYITGQNLLLDGGLFQSAF
ncbi:SDR family oxidoreductase [Thalassobaculum sp.]|uniref:SDR family oxidoreductase n=1 Tax=Thalassobaculum sp. TaxID=2022740 RepID=UPI0032EE19DD